MATPEELNNEGINITGPEHCTQCSHDFNSHVLIAPVDPLQGGITLCPVIACQCFSTWQFMDNPYVKYTTDDPLVVELREDLHEHHLYHSDGDVD